MIFLPLLKRLLLALVLVVGALHGLMLVASPVVQHYRADIERTLASVLGTAVQIGSLQSRWRGLGLGPALVLHDVRIGDVGDGLSLEHAVVDLHLPALLDGSLPDALRFGLTGLRISLIRQANGRVRLAGLPTAGNRDDAGRNLPAHLRLRDTELTFIDQRAGRPPLVLAPVNLRLDRDGDRLRLRGRLDAPVGRLTIAAHVVGDPTGTAWRGAINVVAEDIAVAPLVRGYTPKRFRLESLTLNGELSSHWQDATPVQATGRLTLADLRLDGLGSEPDIALPRLDTGLIRFQRDRQTLALQLDGFSIHGRDGRWPATEVHLHLEPGQTHTTRFATDFVRLQDLAFVARLLDAGTLPGDLLDRAPRGDLRDLRVELGPGDGTPAWRASGRFERLGIDAGTDVPGFEGISGEFRGHSRHLQLDLDGRDVALDLAALFDAPLQLARLAGRLDWQTDDGASWRLASDRLVAATPHLETRSRFLLSDAGDASPHLDLQTEVGPVAVAELGHYYPRRVMRDSLERWLDRGLVGGRIKSGVLVFDGPLADVPFDRTRSGRLIAEFDAEDLVVAYHPEWPRLEAVDALVRFHNNDLEIRIADGRLYDSRIVDGTVLRIPQLDPALPVTVKGRLRGPLADDLRVLAESPLREDFADFVAGLRAEGNAILDLDLDVPIDELGEYRLDGRLTFDGSTLLLESWDLPVTEIRGAITFDLDAIRGSGISAIALDTPVAVTVSPLPAGATRVDVRGELTVARIQQQLPWLPLEQVAHGASIFDVGILIPGLQQQDQATILSVASDLAGVTITLPEPLAKPADGVGALRVELPLDSSRGPTRVRYRDQADAVFAADLSRGRITFGGDRATLPDAPRLQVRGRSTQIDPVPWIHFFGALPDGAGGTRAPLELDLHGDRLTLGGLEFADVRVRLDEETDHWRGRLASTGLAGDFVVPANLDTGTVELELTRLDLPVHDDDAPTGDAADTIMPPPDPATAGLDPREWPSVRLDCRAFSVAGNPLGTLELRAARTPSGLRFPAIRVSGAGHELETDGSWERGADGPRSTFSGHIKTESLGALLTTLGFARQLDAAPATVDFALSWPGDPTDVLDRRLDGTLGMNVAAGSFLDIEPGVARVAGLLNFNGLLRRLRLDFQDLFAKGYAFDSINGEFRIDRGQAVTDDLQIKGPSGLVRIKGRTGLVARDFDQEVSVTPRLDATLPIAGTIAAGPVGGAVALVAQQVLSKQVDEINRFQYRVTGPWDQPVVTQLDTGGTLSKLLRPLSQAGDEPAPAAPPTGDASESPVAPDPEPAPQATEPGPTPDDGAEAHDDAVSSTGEPVGVSSHDPASDLPPPAAGESNANDGNDPNLLRRIWRELRKPAPADAGVGPTEE